MISLKSYYKVLLLTLTCLFTFFLISSPIHALGIPFFHFNDSLCSCSAGGGSGGTFNYGNWFNQGLNTTDNVTVGSLKINFTGYPNAIDWNYFYPEDIFFYNDNVEDSWWNMFRLHYYELYMEHVDSQGLSSLGLERGRIDMMADNYIKLDTASVKVYHSMIFSNLSGSGSAFACLDENGTLYRSATACN